MASWSIKKAREQEKKVKAESAGQVEEFKLVRLDQIEVDPFQPRKTFHEDTISELAKSMEQESLLVPLIVRRVDGSEKLRILDGERRFKAATKLGWDEIRCIVSDVPADKSETQQVMISVCREDLPPLELAEAVNSMIEKGECSQADAAEWMHKGKSWVSEACSIATKLDDSVKEKVRKAEREGKRLPKETLVHAAKQQSAEEQQKVVDMSLEEGKKTKEVRQALKKEAKAEEVKGAEPQTEAEGTEPAGTEPAKGTELAKGEASGKEEDKGTVQDEGKEPSTDPKVSEKKPSGAKASPPEKFPEWSWAPEDGSFTVTFVFSTEQLEKKKYEVLRDAVTQVHRYVTDMKNRTLNDAARTKTKGQGS